MSLHITSSFVRVCSTACTVAALLAGATWLLAQTAAPAGGQDTADAPLLRRDHPPDITTTTRAVLVDVIVQDSKGVPIKGLNANDFVVKEDGAVQRIDSFHEHTAADSAQAAAQLQHARLPPNTFTNFEPASTDNSATVILIDATNTRPQAQAYARYETEKFVKTLKPGTPVAVFLMDTYMHLVQGFTSDPAVLLEAVKSKRDDPRLSPLPSGRGYVSTMFHIETLSQGFADMGRYLAGFPGRKNLVWFTGSVPGASWEGVSPDFPQIEDYDEELKATTETLALSRVSIYPVDARGLETDPAFSAEHSGPPPLISHFNGHFYDHSAMDEIATATGGKAFYNTNGLSQALHEVVDYGSDYYTIAYTPANRNWDGRYRRIHVDLARGDAGVRIQCRQGYYARVPAITPQKRAAALRKAGAGIQQHAAAFQSGAAIASGKRNGFDDAMVLGAIPPTEIIFHASVTPGTGVKKLDKKAWPKDDYLRADLRGKAVRRYHVLYALRTTSVHFAKAPDGSQHSDVAFVAVLYNDKGEQVNSAMTTSQIDFTPQQYARMEHGVLLDGQDIVVPAKGNYFLRFGVHDLDANRVGAMEVPVDDVQPGVAGDGQQLQP